MLISLVTLNPVSYSFLIPVLTICWSLILQLRRSHGDSISFYTTITKQRTERQFSSSIPFWSCCCFCWLPIFFSSTYKHWATLAELSPLFFTYSLLSWSPLVSERAGKFWSSTGFDGGNNFNDGRRYLELFFSSFGSPIIMSGIGIGVLFSSFRMSVGMSLADFGFFRNGIGEIFRFNAWPILSRCSLLGYNNKTVAVKTSNVSTWTNST